MSLDHRVDLLIREDYALFERLKPYAIKWEWFDLPAFAPRGTLVFGSPEKLFFALAETVGGITLKDLHRLRDVVHSLGYAKRHPGHDCALCGGFVDWCQHDVERMERAIRGTPQ